MLAGDGRQISNVRILYLWVCVDRGGTEERYSIAT